MTKTKKAPKKKARRKPGPTAARVRIDNLDAALDSLLGKKPEAK